MEATALLFANLLPGLRDLRAPLASGYLWVLAIVLVLPETGSLRASFAAPLAKLGVLGGFLDAAAVAAALTFAAYLLGSLTQKGIIEPVLYFAMKERRIAWPTVWSTWVAHKMGTSPALDRARRRLSVYIRSRVDRVWDDSRFSLVRPKLATLGYDVSDKEALANVISNRTFRRLKRVATRLQVENERLFDRYDRLRSEAELRIAVALPLFACIVVLSCQSTRWLLLAILVPLALRRQGTFRENESLLVLVDSILAGVVEAPEMADVENAFAARP